MRTAWTISCAVKPDTGGALHKTEPGVRVPETTVTIDCPVVLPIEAVTVTVPTAMAVIEPEPSGANVAMEVSLTDHVTSGLRSPV